MSLVPRRELSKDFTQDFLSNLPTVEYSKSPVQAEIVTTVGAVKILTSQTGIDAFPGMGIREGETIVTKEKGRALLELKDGSNIWLNESTEISLPTAQFRLSLVAGEFFAMMKRQKDAFRIKTPSAALSVLGTDFDAEVNEKKETILSVLKGKVSFKNQSGEVVVRKRKRVRASTYTKPTATKISAPKEVGQWKSSLQTEEPERGNVMKTIFGVVLGIALLLALYFIFAAPKPVSFDMTDWEGAWISEKHPNPNITVCAQIKTLSNNQFEMGVA